MYLLLKQEYPHLLSTPQNLSSHRVSKLRIWIFISMSWHTETLLKERKLGLLALYIQKNYLFEYAEKDYI